MDEGYERLCSHVQQYLESERDPVHEVERAAALIRWARRLRQVEGIDTRPLVARVLARFEQDFYGDDSSWAQEVRHEQPSQRSEGSSGPRDRSR